MFLIGSATTRQKGLPMKSIQFMKATVVILVLSGLGSVMAQDQRQTQEQNMLQQRDEIPGFDYMTQRERETFMERMRLAQTEQERERIRQEHREQMELRMRAIINTREGMGGVGSGSGLSGESPKILKKKSGARR